VFDNRSYVLRRSATGVTASLADPSGSGPGIYNAIAASSASDVWTAGGSTVEQLTGGAWTSAGMPSTPSIAGVAALSPSDVWVAGESSTSHWDGSGWTGVPNAFTLTTANITSLAASGTADVWAGSDQGFIMHWNGSTWALGPATGVTSSIVRMTAPVPGFAMAAGSFGVVGWNGTAWAPAGITLSASSVWAGSATDAWAIVWDATAAKTRIFHWNGSTWTESSPGLLIGFTTIDVGGSGSDAWVMGQGGQLLHRP
jgi:hypothetical protein